jgi:hypothetical protein
MPEKIHDPATYKERNAEPPVHSHQEHDASEDDGNPNRVEEFVPRVSVLVIVLRHVLMKLRHATPRCGVSQKTAADDCFRANYYNLAIE